MIIGRYKENPVWIAKVGVGEHGNCAIIIDQQGKFLKVWLEEITTDFDYLDYNSQVN